MAAIAITRTDLTAAELRLASGKAPDARSARRMLALALVLEGVDRKTAAETCGMDRQTLRDWVHRYNAEGLLGLTNRHYAGPPRRLSASEALALLRPPPAEPAQQVASAARPAGRLAALLAALTTAFQRS